MREAENNFKETAREKKLYGPPSGLSLSPTSQLIQLRAGAGSQHVHFFHVQASS